MLKSKPNSISGEMGIWLCGVPQYLNFILVYCTIYVFTKQMNVSFLLLVSPHLHTDIIFLSHELWDTFDNDATVIKCDAVLPLGKEIVLELYKVH